MTAEGPVQQVLAFQSLVHSAEAALKTERILARSCEALREATKKRDVVAIRQHAHAAQERLSELSAEIVLLLDRCSEEGTNRLSEAEADRAFREACREAGLVPFGSFPRYYVPPVEVIFRREKGATAVGSRTVRSIHPLLIASAICAELQHLENQGYPAERLAPIIVRAHDLLVSESLRRTGKALQQVPIREIHDLIRSFASRANYSTTQFGYDIARLRDFMGRHSVFPTPIFGDTRQITQGIPVPGPSSMQYVGYVEVRGEITNDR